VIERRDTLERTLSGLLMQHAETVLLEGDRQQAAASLGRLVELEPMREDLHLLYWQVLLDLGRRSEIVHGYMGLARRLSDELGIEPSQELRQFYEQVLE
jgi:DNA-binding SARP family transcriptional activator